MANSLRLALLLGICAAVISALETARGLQDQIHEVAVLHHTSLLSRRNVHSWETQTITLEFLHMTFTLELRHHHELFSHGITAIEIGEDGVERPFRIDQENYWVGIVNGDPKSHAELYISPQGSMHGSIVYRDEEYILEHPYRHYPNTTEDISGYTVVYRAKDLINKYDPHSGRNASGHSFCGIEDHHDFQIEQSEAQVHERRAQQFTNRDRRVVSTGHVSAMYNFCLATLVADFSFYNNNGAATSTVSSVLLGHINQASSVFNGAYWFSSYSNMTNAAAKYSNLKLSTSKIIVYSSSVSDPYSETSTYGGSGGPQSLLSKFSQAPGQALGWKSCVAHLFTHYNFAGGTLGLAWVGSPSAGSAGGICDSAPGASYNTGWTTDTNNFNAVPSLMDRLVTTHEFGHNFGSPHDTAGAICLGGSNGYYLMYPTAVSGAATNNVMFSPCSITNITGVLTNKGTCFSSDPSGFCGDYSVGSGEQCDAGLNGDSCCTSTCTFVAGATCSDTVDICCKNCTPAGSSINCFVTTYNDASCRATTACSLASVSTCPTPAAAPSGVPCGSGGICNGNFGNSTSCVSICSRFGAESCTCSGSSICQVCCQHNPAVPAGSCGTPFQSYGVSGNYTCTPAVTALASVTNETCLRQPYWSTTLGKTILYNSTQIDPACNSNTSSLCWRLLDVLPNTPCGSSSVCDNLGQCSAVVYSTPTDNTYSLDSISLSSAQKWMQQNIVGTVLIFSFVVWLPIGILIHRYDVKQREKNAAYGMRSGNAMTFRPKAVAQGRPPARR